MRESGAQERPPRRGRWGGAEEEAGYGWMLCRGREGGREGRQRVWERPREEAGRESVAQGRQWRVGTKWWRGGAGVKVCQGD